MKNLVGSLIAVAILASCNTLMPVTPEYNPEKRVFNSLEYGEMISHQVIFFRNYFDELSIERVDTEAGPFFVLRLKYKGDDWRFMEELSLRADGQLLKFEDKRPARDVLSGGTVLEQLSFPITEVQAAQISNASEVLVQYYLQPTTIDETGIKSLNNFYRDFVATK